MKDTLPSSTVAPRIARRLTDDALRDRSLRDAAHPHLTADCREDVALVVSELVTNAVMHATGPIEFEVNVDGDVIELRVTDHTTDPPTVTYANGDRIGGAGLRIVERLARFWGVEQQPDGKVVWCQLSLKWV